MSKPWARLEQNYINHPKFLALSANAICLWHEGKNYCDMHHTDGLISRDSMKIFRFSGKVSIAQLLRSCGVKPNGDAYAPLWEEHPVGYKMHDYLEHNDCRDKVLARMELADAKRDLGRARQQEWRAKRHAERNAPSNALPDALRNAPHNADVTLQQKQIQKQIHNKQELSESVTQAASARAKGIEDEISERAGRLVEAYEELFTKHRNGARYRRQPTLDWSAACDLCRIWDDERLKKLAAIVLTTDDPFISGTDRGFKIFSMKASWADDKLAQWEASHQVRA